MKYKKCSKCQKTRPVVDFRKHNSSLDGYLHQCQECRDPSRYYWVQEQVLLQSQSEKRCSRCKQIKPLIEFSRCKTRKDGYNITCKTCASAYQTSDRGHEANKRYNRAHKDKISENNKKRIIRNTNALVSLAFRKNNPEKVSAHKKIYYAIKKGRIPHPSTLVCKECGAQANDYHHPDYSKPLNVIPLCRSCHNIVHRRDS